MDTASRWLLERRSQLVASGVAVSRGLGIAVMTIVLVNAAACRSEDPAVVKAEAIERGRTLMSQKQFAEAASAYRIAVEIEPRNPELRLAFAQALEASEQWEQASRQYISAAELRPEDWRLQVKAVRWMLALSRFQDAAARASSLLRLRPDDIEALVLLGCAKARLRFPEVAIVDLEPMLRRGESIESARLDLRVKPSAAEDREAEAAFRKAYALAPDQAGTRVTLAGFLWSAGDPNAGAALLRIAVDRNPGDARVSRVLGLFYQQRGADADAEIYLKNAARNDRESVMLLADFYIGRQRLDEALAALVPLLPGEGEPAPDVSVRIADVDWRQQRPAQAGQRVDVVLARDPANGRALAIKAQVLFAAKEFTKAAECARAALAAGHRSHETRLLLARSLAAGGSHQAAADEYASLWRESPSDASIAKELASLALLLGRFDVAVEFARHGVRLDANDKQAHITLVRALIGLGDFAGAERALGALPAGPSPSPEALLLLAAAQRGRGARDQAAVTYTRVLQTQPDSIDALTGLVELALEAGPSSEARARADRAAEQHPRDPAYLLLAARMARASGDETRAEVLLHQILQLDPAHEQATVLLTEGLTRRGRYADAIALLEQTLSRRPASLEVQLSLARLLEATGRRSEAIDRYEQVLTEHPQATLAAYRLAALYAAAGERLDRALELASTAKQQLPNDAAVSHALGWVHLSRNLPASALPHLIDAVNGSSNNALYRYHLGLAYLRTGSPQKARPELTLALEIDPRFPYAAEARTALAKIGR